MVFNITKKRKDLAKIMFRIYALCQLLILG